jgi:hypothetical protein
VEDVAASVAGLAVLALPSVLIPAQLRIRGRAPFAVACLTVAAAQIVFAFILLSLVEGLTRGGLLVLQTTFAALATGAWFATGRPRPPVYLSDRAALRPLAVMALVREHPVLALTTGIAAAALALQLLMAVAVAPNNFDAMTYHLSRGAYWLQYQSATYFPGGSEIQLGWPPNAEMMQAWTMAMSRGDAFTQVVQWIALIGLGVTIFSCARLLAFCAPAALFAACIFVLLPLPLLEATTPQNDLVVSFFALAAGFFGVRGLRDNSAGDLAVAGTALGLAIGTKGTAFAALPSLSLVIALAVWRFRPRRATLVIGAAVGVAGVIALGAFNYVLNLRNTDDLFGGVERSNRTFRYGRVSPVADNTIRIAWTLADLPGINAHALNSAVQTAGDALLPDLSSYRFAGKDFSYAVDTAVSEDSSAFGAVGFVLLLPLLAVVLVARQYRGPPQVVAAAAILYLLTFSFLAEYNPYVGRLLMPFAAISAPLFAVLAQRAWLRALALVLVLISLAAVLLENPHKRLLNDNGGRSVLDYTYLEQQTLSRPELRTVIPALADRIGADAPLGFVPGHEGWDYPLFGEGLERRVVRLRPSQATYQRMEEEGLAGILVHGDPPKRMPSEELAPDYYFSAAAPGP